MRLQLSGCVVAMLIGACQGSPSSDPAIVRQIIEGHNADAARWYAAGQIDSVASLFAQDVWQFPPNSPPVVGRDSLVSFWTTASGWGRWQFAFRVQDVVTSGPLAVERGQYTLEFTAGSSSPIPSVQDRGNYVVLWRREADGAWRIVWDAPVSVVPLPQPAGR